MSDTTSTDSSGAAGTVSGGAAIAGGSTATPATTATDSTGTGATLFGFPLGNWVERGFLIIIGLTILAFGLWHLFTAQQPRSPPS